MADDHVSQMVTRNMIAETGMNEASGGTARLRRASESCEVPTPWLAFHSVGCRFRRPASGGLRSRGRDAPRPSPLINGVPGNGQMSIVVAVHAGRVIDQAKVRPGEPFTLSVPPGSYQVGLWPPGQPPGVIECPGYATVSGGQTATVTLECTRS